MTNQNGITWCCGHCYHYNEVEPWEIDETIAEGFENVISECGNCGHEDEFDIPDDWQQPEPDHWPDEEVIDDRIIDDEGTMHGGYL